MSHLKPLTNQKREEIIFKISASLNVPASKVRQVLNAALPLIHNYGAVDPKYIIKREWIEPLQ